MSELYRRYVGRLSSVCYRYVPDEDDAKDVLQNSFVKIFTSMQNFEYHDESSFEGFMARVVAHEALHFLRDRKKLMLTDLQEDSVRQATDDAPEIERITADDLHQLISELPDGYRTVVNLYIFEGYSHRKIAELLGIKETTSATQLYHAKQLLARRIKEIIDEER
ncbi:MAG: sigma-70 family RNA polymerase sigma factor [Prevotella sp.]|nr:sigma-70 family RNA polymerase sigma factor [Prevotella sp.]